MSNEKLIKSMLACDGTAKNCEGCTFRDIPDCRNAMVHHGGALIQLQDVVIANSATLAGGLHMRLAASEQQYQEAVEVVGKQRVMLHNLINGLKENRHCESCAGSKPYEKPEDEETRVKICDACMHGEESHWCLEPDFGKEEEAEDLGEPESDEVLQPVEDEE